MNELREKIARAMILAKGATVEQTSPRSYKIHHLSDIEDDIDAILDAVIAALPFTSADDEDGYVTAISEVKSLLEAAKESK